MGNSSSASSDDCDFKDVIHGSNLPLGYSTRDERMEITTSTAVPYCWICRLTIETQQGRKYSATGFKICIKPLLQHQIILTSAHSVFVDGSFAKRITITFPGQNSTSVSSKNLWAPKEFTQDKSPDYNFGVIRCTGSSEDGFNWTTLLSDDELTGRPLSCCGYTADKVKGSLWITGGGVESVTKNNIQYMYDSRNTLSGSAVYTWHKGYWTAVGIQSHSGNFNSALRLTSEVMRSILQAIGFPLQYNVQSKEFPDTYLCTHMNTLDIDKEEEIVTIGYQSGKAEPQGVFEIIPLSSLPESHQACQVVCVSPVPCKDVYLSFTSSNGAKQNCQVNVKNELIELYLHNQKDGSIAIESTSEPGLYLSLSDTPLGETNKRRTSVIERGSGSEKVITCHFVPEKCEIRSTEKFILHQSVSPRQHEVV